MEEKKEDQMRIIDRGGYKAVVEWQDNEYIIVKCNPEREEKK